MRYRVWVFREDTGATMPVEFDGVVGAVDEIMRHMKEHGAYRTAIPVRGCWVLAEVVK